MVHLLLVLKSSMTEMMFTSVHYRIYLPVFIEMKVGSKHGQHRFIVQKNSFFFGSNTGLAFRAYKIQQVRILRKQCDQMTFSIFGHLQQ